MPSFEHHGARIYYEEFGQGFPILTFAPAGLHSTSRSGASLRRRSTRSTEFAGNFRVIAMDQRNAGGQSRAPITAQDGWDSYTADHIALLDHLGIDRCHLYGQCIGGSFILNLMENSRSASPPRFWRSRSVGSARWRPAVRRGSRPGRIARGSPGSDAEVLDAFYRNLYGPGFVYCVDRDFVRTVTTPASCWRATTRRTPMHLGRAGEVVAEQRVHPGMEDRRGTKSARAQVEEFYVLKRTPRPGLSAKREDLPGDSGNGVSAHARTPLNLGMVAHG